MKKSTPVLPAEKYEPLALYLAAEHGEMEKAKALLKKDLFVHLVKAL